MQRSVMLINRLVAVLLLFGVVNGFCPSQPFIVPRPLVGVSSDSSWVNLKTSSRLPRTQHHMSDPRRNADFQSKKQSRRSVKRVSNKVLSLTVAVALSTAATSLFAPAASALDLSIATNSLAAAPSWLSGLSQTGFYQAFSLVFLSEIGDKTFFIAGLLSAKTSRLISFIGSMGALAAMTLVSVAIGQIFHAVPEGFANGIPLDDVAACLAFLFFGLKTLKEAFDLEPGESVMDEEFSEAQEAVDGSESVKQTTPWGQLASIFALVFAAEFGDRSFLSTIALSAAQNPVAVAGGAIAAHGVATGIAVSGGAVLAKYLSERVLGFIGGTLFIVFAITTAFGIF